MPLARRRRSSRLSARQVVCIVLATRLAAADGDTDSAAGADVLLDAGGVEEAGSWEPEPEPEPPEPSWHHCDGTQCVKGFGPAKNYQL
jgi:hypothetical protein